MLKRARSPMMASLSHVALAQLAFFWFSLNPLAAQTACGAKAVVQRGDTLSRIAERCEISEGDLLRANPDVEGSADLRVGMELSLRSPERQLADRVESFARSAGDKLSGLAQEFGSSVDDLLEKNPDLRQRLRGLGDRLSVPGLRPREGEDFAHAAGRGARLSGQPGGRGIARERARCRRRGPDRVRLRRPRALPHECRRDFANQCHRAGLGGHDQAARIRDRRRRWP